MRAPATLLLSAVMALTALGLAVAAPGGAPAGARAELAAPTGTVRIVNSREGASVLEAAALRPGAVSEGTVEIANGGDAAGRFSLAPAGLADTPGPNGGRLSERLRVEIVDLTARDRPHDLYSGPIAELGTLDLGTVVPGAARDYRFLAWLPDGGAPGSASEGDNRYQGAALEVGFDWRATAIAGAPVVTPGPTPAPTASPRPPAAPRPPARTPVPTPAPAAPRAPAATTPADALGLPSARTCIARRRLRLRLHAPGGQRVARVTVRVSGHRTIRRSGRRARRPIVVRRLRPGRVRVRVRLRDSAGHRYRVTRTYRTCRRPR